MTGDRTAEEVPIEVIRAFCASWEAGDPDAIVAFFSDEATYQNMMDEPWRGRETIREVIRSFFTVTPSIEFRIRNIAADGDVVLAERIDICTTTAGVKAHLPLVGVFEVRDGRISAWRDYYDNAQFRRLMQHAPRADGSTGDTDLGVAVDPG